MTTEETLEDKARQLGNDPKALHERLLRARRVLAAEYKWILDRYTFDFDGKRLVSKCETHALCWRIRTNPDEPISYVNQQTSQGEVYLTILNPYKGYSDGNNERASSQDSTTNSK